MLLPLSVTTPPAAIGQLVSTSVPLPPQPVKASAVTVGAAAKPTLLPVRPVAVPPAVLMLVICQVLPAVTPLPMVHTTLLPALTLYALHVTPPVPAMLT